MALFNFLEQALKMPDYSERSLNSGMRDLRACEKKMADGRYLAAGASRASGRAKVYFSFLTNPVGTVLRIRDEIKSDLDKSK